MATIAELWETPAKAPSAPAPDQQQREAKRLEILRKELADEQAKVGRGDAAAQARTTANIQSLQAEIGRQTGQKPAPAPQPTGTTIADLWEAPAAPAPAAAGAAVIPGWAAPAPAPAPAPEEPKPSFVADILQRYVGPAYRAVQQAPAYLKGGAEAAVKLAEQTATLPLLIAQGGGTTADQQRIARLREAMSGYKVGPEGQRILEAVGDVLGAAKIPPVVPEAGALAAAAQVKPTAAPRAKAAMAEWKAQLESTAAPGAVPTAMPPGGSVGAMATPNTAIIQQALSVASPELKAQISNIPVNKVNIPTLQRHIEADTLPTPVRLTEGQATGDVVKLSKEQNRKGQDSVLAQRFNEQNGQLIDNLEKFRERAAPDAYGAKTIDHSQSILDAYKTLDNTLTTNIDAKYQALRDAAGGQFPVDAPKLLQNVQNSLKKQLLSNDAPPSQFKELQRLAESNSMTFEDFLSLRRNLGNVARTAQDGNVRTAASLMIKELENLPLQEGARQLKPLADQARKAARDRFQMLERDPAYRAAVNDTVPADKFLEKFVINGHNKNVQAMIDHLGADSVARQHMAAGTINYLRDRAGIIDNQGNFSQSGYNKALKFLDDSNKLPLIFDGETSTGLKTLGNVARYTQAQPRGSFVNNSNTLVGALAERAATLTKTGIEQGLNIGVPGLQLGSQLMEMRARRAAAKETEKALAPGAGIRE